jgi:hypothetical protein
MHTITPPATALAGLLPDIMDLRRLLAKRQPRDAAAASA